MNRTQHLIMYREVSPPEILAPLVQPVCICGWEGLTYPDIVTADKAGDFHLKHFERFPRPVTSD